MTSGWTTKRFEDESGNYVIYHEVVMGNVGHRDYLRKYIGREFDMHEISNDNTENEWYYPIDPSDGSFLICKDANGTYSVWELHYKP